MLFEEPPLGGFPSWKLVACGALQIQSLGFTVCGSGFGVKGLWFRV